MDQRYHDESGEYAMPGVPTHPFKPEPPVPPMEEAIGGLPPKDVCPICGYEAWGRRVWESGGARFCAVCEARQERNDAVKMEHENYQRGLAEGKRLGIEAAARVGLSWLLSSLLAPRVVTPPKSNTV